MPDWTKRVIKERADDLLPDETLIAACYFQGRGSAMGQIMFGAVRGVGGSVASEALANTQAARARDKTMKQSKEGHNTFEGSIAARFPDDKGVVAVTNRRLIAFGYSQGIFKTKIEDPVAVVERQHLIGWSYQPGKVAAVLNLAFNDESDVGIELPRANKPDGFADALGIPRQE